MTAARQFLLSISHIAFVFLLSRFLSFYRIISLSISLVLDHLLPSATHVFLCRPIAVMARQQQQQQQQPLTLLRSAVSPRRWCQSPRHHHQFLSKQFSRCSPVQWNWMATAAATDARNRSLFYWETSFSSWRHAPTLSLRLTTATATATTAQAATAVGGSWVSELSPISRRRRRREKEEEAREK